MIGWWEGIHSNTDWMVDVLGSREREWVHFPILSHDGSSWHSGRFSSIIAKFVIPLSRKGVPGCGRRDESVRNVVAASNVVPIATGTSRVTSVAYLQGATTNQPAGAAPHLQGRSISFDLGALTTYKLQRFDKCSTRTSRAIVFQ